MKPRSLDTNILLRWLLGDVPKQQQIVDDLIAKKRTYHLADATVVELVFVLEKVIDMPRSLVATNLEAIMGRSNINCNRKLFKKAIELYLSHPSESFLDCCLVVYADLRGVKPLLTFDKKLAKNLPHAELVG